MPPPDDEKTLVNRAKSGDKTAIGMLYSTHVQAIYKYVRYRVDTDALAEDHVQLRQALQSLSPDYQNTLILRFINDVPHAEVDEFVQQGFCPEKAAPGGCQRCCWRSRSSSAALRASPQRYPPSVPSSRTAR